MSDFFYFDKPRNWNTWIMVAMMVIITIVGVRSGSEELLYIVLPFIAVILYIQYRIKRIGFDDRNIYLEGSGKREIVPFEKIIKIRIVQRREQLNMWADKFKVTYLDEYGQKKSRPFLIVSAQLARWHALQQMIAAANPEVIIDVDGPTWG